MYTKIRLKIVSPYSALMSSHAAEIARVERILFFRDPINFVILSLFSKRV
jgi:hypothetical protein